MVEVRSEKWYGSHPGAIKITDSACKDCKRAAEFSVPVHNTDSVDCRWHMGWILLKDKCEFKLED